MIAKKMQEAVSKLRKDMLQSIGTAQKAEVGISDESIAQYAVYQEYGWVQRVTGKQAAWFANQGVNHPPRPGNSLVLPPRPFFRATIDACSEDWSKLFVRTLKALGPDEFLTALQLTAQKAAEDFRDTVRNGGTSKVKFEDRAPLTMELYQQQSATTSKGNARRINGGNVSTTQPLVKTGAMLNAIGWNLKK